MKIGKSEFIVTNKNGSIFIDHIFDGSIVDTMKVYGLKGKPYCRRMSVKMYLSEELLNEMRLMLSH